MLRRINVRWLALALLLALPGVAQAQIAFTARPPVTVTRAAPNTTTAGTAAEECLYSLSIPMMAVGDAFAFSYVAQHAANANNASIGIRVGQGACTANTSLGSNPSTGTGTYYAGQYQCTRVSAAVLLCIRNQAFQTSAEVGSPAIVIVGGLTLPGNVLVGITGTTAVAAGDVTLLSTAVMAYQ